MKAPRYELLGYGTLAIVLAFCAAPQGQSAQKKNAGPADSRPAKVPSDNALSDDIRLIGAWHLVRIEAPGPDGKPNPIPQPQGMLIYTRDGHVSVQLMYPASESALSNEYVQAGYEASFGSYDIDETTHTVTHHVQGSVTRDLLVGKNLPRVYQFTPDGRLIIKSSRPDEHWSVTWEHY